MILSDFSVTIHAVMMRRLVLVHHADKHGEGDAAEHQTHAAHALLKVALVHPNQRHPVVVAVLAVREIRQLMFRFYYF